MRDIQQEQKEILEELNEETFSLHEGQQIHDCVSGYARAQAGLTSDAFPYGEAIVGAMVFDEVTKRWWISNGAQSSPILFCPYCGKELRKLFGMA